MRFRIVGLVGMAAALAVVALVPDVNAQPATSKVISLYGHDVRVRKGGNPDFGPDTPRYGVEFYKDESDTAAPGIIVCSQAGHLAAISSVPLGADKKATWLFAHDMRARKGDVAKFDPSTAKFGVEVFKDLATNRLLYISDSAYVTIAEVPSSLATEKGPTHHHGLTMKVRKANEPKFDQAQKFGIEAYTDGNTGGLIYISETGSLAAAPAPTQPTASDNVKAPTALHGLSLRVRKADEDDFGPNTKVFGVEVIRDENTGGLIFISETGAIATAPAPAQLKTGSGVPWKHGMTLRARPGGVSEFGKANKYGVEAYLDNNTGYTVYISETGSIAVLAKK